MSVSPDSGIDEKELIAILRGERPLSRGSSISEGTLINNLRGVGPLRQLRDAGERDLKKLGNLSTAGATADHVRTGRKIAQARLAVQSVPSLVKINSRMAVSSDSPEDAAVLFSKPELHRRFNEYVILSGPLEAASKGILKSREDSFSDSPYTDVIDEMCQWIYTPPYENGSAKNVLSSIGYILSVDPTLAMVYPTLQPSELLVLRQAAQLPMDVDRDMGFNDVPNMPVTGEPATYSIRRADYISQKAFTGIRNRPPPFSEAPCPKWDTTLAALCTTHCPEAFFTLPTTADISKNDNLLWNHPIHSYSSPSAVPVSEKSESTLFHVLDVPNCLYLYGISQYGSEVVVISHFNIFTVSQIRSDSGWKQIIVLTVNETCTEYCTSVTRFMQRVRLENTGASDRIRKVMRRIEATHAYQNTPEFTENSSVSTCTQEGEEYHFSSDDVQKRVASAIALSAIESEELEARVGITTSAMECGMEIVFDFAAGERFLAVREIESIKNSSSRTLTDQRLSMRSRIRERAKALMTPVEKRTVREHLRLYWFTLVNHAAKRKRIREILSSQMRQANHHFTNITTSLMRLYLAKLGRWVTHRKFKRREQLAISLNNTKALLGCYFRKLQQFRSLSSRDHRTREIKNQFKVTMLESELFQNELQWRYEVKLEETRARSEMNGWKEAFWKREEMYRARHDQDLQQVNISYRRVIRSLSPLVPVSVHNQELHSRTPEAIVLSLAEEIADELNSLRSLLQNRRKDSFTRRSDEALQELHHTVLKHSPEARRRFHYSPNN
eukprot:TRINITY_DN1315_c2_g1_i1.p1 TRINITY_DN1315_c2_g1~~TRINITY_DN1315_c2_g1_i1.p1  ORF type:complete len:784 (+),score=112.01 TRINITY_DN1315_c2_g1_i1:834-3185(+)